MSLEKLIEKTKFLNQSRLFLIWGFGVAIMLSTSLELLNLLYEFIENKSDYALALGLIFLLGLILTLIVGKVISREGKDANKTYNILKNNRGIIK